MNPEHHVVVVDRVIDQQTPRAVHPKWRVDATALAKLDPALQLEDVAVVVAFAREDVRAGRKIVVYQTGTRAGTPISWEVFAPIVPGMVGS